MNDKAISRVTFNLDSELVKKIDQFAKMKYINRTSAVSFLLSESLDIQFLENPNIVKNDMEN